MKNAIVAALLLTSTSFATAAGPLGYPGVTWNTIVASNKSGVDQPALQMQGIIEQGIDWTHLDVRGKWTLNTYAAVTYSLDSNSARTYTPQIGVKTNRRYDNGSLDLGVRVMDNHGTSKANYLPGSPSVSTGKGRSVQAYGTFWFDWNLKK